MEEKGRGGIFEVKIFEVKIFEVKIYVRVRWGERRSTKYRQTFLSKILNDSKH